MHIISKNCKNLIYK